jgi:hypothetical protein
MQLGFKDPVIGNYNQYFIQGQWTAVLFIPHHQMQQTS